MKSGMGKKRKAVNILTSPKSNGEVCYYGVMHRKLRVISQTTQASPSTSHVQHSVALIATGPSVASHLPLICVWLVLTASRNKS